jgi:uncharacterized protein
MRSSRLIAGAVLFVAVVAAAVALWRRGEAPSTSPLTASTTTAAVTSPAASFSAAPSAAQTRALAFHLLTAADPAEVRAGVETLTKAADQGDTEAQVGLGRIYLQGVPSVPKDAERARQWLLRAAPSRHPSAAYFLGVMSQTGQGVQADPTEAARWFAIAAEAGSPHAMFLLANAYSVGAGVPRDTAKAVALYEKAGELEYAPALQTLAMAYQYGELGLAPDEAESRRYFMEAEHAIKHRQSPP